MKQIKLNLVISLIMEAVKSETYIKGTIDKSLDDKASAMAYHEEAGDETFHDRKLFRTLHVSLSRLSARIGDYLADSSVGSADNVFKTDITDNEALTITLSVNDRFNETFTDPLAKLCSRFIEDHMLYLWWGTFNVKQAEFYKSLLEVDFQDITSCLTKRSPYIPSTSYTSDIDLVGFIETQMGYTLRVTKDEEFTVTYQVSDDCVDDVMVRFDNGCVSKVGQDGRSFILKANYVGVCIVTLYSRHDEDICKDLTVIVSA